MLEQKGNNNKKSCKRDEPIEQRARVRKCASSRNVIVRLSIE